MIAAVTRSTVRAFSHFYQYPARLLERVAIQMHDDLEKLEMFVTIAVGIVDVPEGLVRVASAGHCPVVITHPGGEFTEACPEPPPPGLEKNPYFLNTKCPSGRACGFSHTPTAGRPAEPTPNF